MFSPNERPVAQVSNLLYRGFPTRGRHQIPQPADWKSAIQQVGNLRYAKQNPEGTRNVNGGMKKARKRAR